MGTSLYIDTELISQFLVPCLSPVFCGKWHFQNLDLLEVAGGKSSQISLVSLRWALVLYLPSARSDPTFPLLSLWQKITLKAYCILLSIKRFSPVLIAFVDLYVFFSFSVILVHLGKERRSFLELICHV